jgi:hypothetical protein
VFDDENNGIAILTDWRTLAGADPALAPDHYDIGVRPGVSAWAYVHSFGLRSTRERRFATGLNDTGPIFPEVLILLGTLMSLLVTRPPSAWSARSC